MGAIQLMRHSQCLSGSSERRERPSLILLVPRPFHEVLPVFYDMKSKSKTCPPSFSHHWFVLASSGFPLTPPLSHWSCLTHHVDNTLVPLATLATFAAARHLSAISRCPPPLPTSPPSEQMLCISPRASYALLRAEKRPRFP